uniref:Casein kinase II subunit beta n=1 Tax=Euplotoides octocarinatus TaxID=2716877 RepID=A0A0G3ELU5_EUPOC|nr:casein kinase II beta-3 [Euplotes octocarinatus]
MDLTEEEALAVEAMQQYDNGSDSNMDYDNISEDNTAPAGWIQWFCSLEGHDFLLEIEEDYIKDYFNLFGLKKRFKTDRYSTCLKMILSNYSPTEEDLQNEEFLELNQEASDLYGLIHSRFVITQRGLSKLYNKFLNGIYGYCPRALCDRQKVLPVGLSDELRTSRVKVFCPKCEEVYIPKYKSINVDGAYFGTSVPHIFLKTFKESAILPPRVFNYEPKIHGFNLYKKVGSRAEGSKDVIIYPKSYSSQAASNELKNLNDEIREEKILQPNVVQCEEVVIPQKSSIPDEDVPMMEKENSEQAPLHESNHEEEHEGKQNMGNKKQKKKNKKNKNKGRN